MMKRLLVLVLLLLFATGCSAGRDKYSGRFDREGLLPDSYISELAGVPMKLAYDRREISAGYMGWAWEETGGTPKLLTIEIRFPPTNCEQLYTEVKEHADGMHAPEGMTACSDARAVHVRSGDYYIRLVALGISDEDTMVKRVMDKLADMIQSE